MRSKKKTHLLKNREEEEEEKGAEFLRHYLTLTNEHYLMQEASSDTFKD